MGTQQVDDEIVKASMHGMLYQRNVLKFIIYGFYDGSLAKYFAILPSLYYHAAHCGRKFSSVREVERYVIEREVQITCQLVEYDDGIQKTGITGINTYKAALSITPNI